jgi:serine/threonine protein kinase
MSAIIGRTKITAADLNGFLSPPLSADELGRVDGYRVLKVIGDGGMGLVLEAEDGKGRRVAIKVLRPGRKGDDDARQRFQREARIAAGLFSPRLLPLLKRGQVQGLPYLVLPLLVGQTLEERLRREGCLPIADAVRIARQTAEGLAAVHGAGVVHRDIKPANLWLDSESDSVKVIDFGLARFADDPTAKPGDELLTRFGTTLGTPGYMAPEQIGGGDADGRADLFALGCVLYRMVTGMAPFAGRGLGDVLRKTMTEHPPSPRSLNAAVPRRLDALIMRLLTKDRTDRPESAREVADELGSLHTASSEGSRRSWLLAGLALLGVAAAAAVLYLRGW